MEGSQNSDIEQGEIIDAAELAKRWSLPESWVRDQVRSRATADENDNQEMRGILRQLSTIQAEIGCGIGVVHHYNKADQGSMTQRLRGSSAIAGWAEWLIGISMADEETKTRRVEFELKAAQPPDPIYYQIDNTEEATRLSPSELPNLAIRRREGSSAERYMV